MADVVTKVGVEGAQQYKAKMAELTSSAKRLDSEMAALTSGFDENTSEAEKTAKKQELLARQMDNQQAIVDALADKYGDMNKKLAELKKAAEEAASGGAENAAEAQKAQLAYTKYQTAVNKAATELNDAQAKLNGMKNGLADTGKAAEDSEKKISVFGDTLKANLSADVIKGIVSGAWDLATGLAKATKNIVLDSAAYADEIITLSTTTGLATDALQEYYYMAQLVDVSVDTLTGSQTKLIKSMRSAKSGGKAAVDIFHQLGVAVTNDTGELRNVADVFDEALAALAGIENETERDAAAMEIFGKSARELNPLIEASADTLQALREEAHRTGYVLSDEQLAALGKVDDGYQRMENRVDSLKHQLGVSLAPAAEAVFDVLENIADAVDWETLAGYIRDNADAFRDWATSINIDELKQKLSDGAEAFRKFKEAVDKTFSVFQEFGHVFGLILPETRRKELEALYDQSAQDFANSFGPELAAELEQNGEDAADAITTTIGEAANYLDGLSDESYIWGRDMMANLTKGIHGQRPLLTAEIDGIATDISERLHHSRPDKGPLRDDNMWMPDMMQSLAAGIEANRWRLEEAAESAAAAVAAPILMNRQQAASVQNGHNTDEILDAIRGVGGAMQTTVVLEGDAREMFRVVRQQNNRVFAATGYNQLGRR